MFANVVLRESTLRCPQTTHISLLVTVSELLRALTRKMRLLSRSAAYLVRSISLLDTIALTLLRKLPAELVCRL